MSVMAINVLLHPDAATVEFARATNARVRENFPGMNYHPHLTVGIGMRDFIDALEAAPFTPFPVKPTAVSLYQVGNYGVAQRKLRDLHRG
jgi:hypothetical protein